MSRSGALSTIETILKANSDPDFDIVLRHEPLSIASGDRVACFFFSGESEKSMTLGNVMVTQDFMVRCYFRVQSSIQGRNATELELWNACRSVQTGLRADSQLSGNCSDMTIGDAEIGWTDIGGNTFRTLSLPLGLVELEAEAIAP
jgi:hypothetical protein